MTYEQIIERIAAERRWQVAQAIEPTLTQLIRVLGDVAHAVADSSKERLGDGLIKLAAHAFAWLESL